MLSICKSGRSREGSSSSGWHAGFASFNHWAFGSVPHIKHPFIIHQDALEEFIWKEFHITRTSLCLILSFVNLEISKKEFLKPSFIPPSERVSSENNEGDKKVGEGPRAEMLSGLFLGCVLRRKRPLHTHARTQTSKLQRDELYAHFNSSQRWAAACASLWWLQH